MKTVEKMVEQKELFTLNSAANLLTLIDNQIKQIEQDYLSDWEKDHSYSKADRDARIQELVDKKNMYKALFSESAADAKVVVSVALHNTTQNVEEEVEEMSY